MGLFGKKKKTDKSATATPGKAVLSNGESVTLARSVDCLGDSCPRPQLMTKKAVKEIGVGEVIEVLVDNPSSVEALPPMCDEMGATHLDTIQEARCWKVYIRKD